MRLTVICMGRKIAISGFRYIGVQRDTGVENPDSEIRSLYRGFLRECVISEFRSNVVQGDKGVRFRREIRTSKIRSLSRGAGIYRSSTVKLRAFRQTCVVGESAYSARLAYCWFLIAGKIAIHHPSCAVDIS